MSLERWQELVAIAVVIAVAGWYVRSALRARRNAAGGCRSACGGCGTRPGGCTDSDEARAARTPRS